MPDQTQPHNNLSPDALKAENLGKELRQVTTLAQAINEGGTLGTASTPKVSGMLHSMQHDVVRAHEAPLAASMPVRSLADALKDVIPTTSQQPPHVQSSQNNAPQTQIKSESYRETIEDGGGLGLQNTPISGVNLRTENAPSAMPKEAMIHTLKYDVQDLVKKKKVSMIRAIALESDKTATAETIGRPIQLNKKSSNAGVYIMSTLFFVLGGITIGAVLYAQSMQEQQTREESSQLLAQNSLVFYEHQQQFDITDLQPYEMKGGLAQMREKLTATLGSFTLIQMTLRPYDAVTGQYSTRYATLQDVANTMKPHMPRALTSILKPDFMLALHTTEETAPMLLLTGDTYDTSLAGMLAWESAMANDLAPFFPSRGATITGGASQQFDDLSVDNIDARILRAPNKKVRIVYAILEKNIIAVTNNIYTLKEIANRVHARTSNAQGVGL